MKRFAILLAAFLAVAGVAAAAPDDSVRAYIMKLDAEWSKAAQEQNVERSLFYWSEDATVLPPGRAALVGKAAIREFIEKSFQTPGFSISWKAATVTVSTDGDMAYTTGTNHVTFKTPDGKIVAVEGKAVTVWRRQKDGTWKCVIDIWNHESPQR
jgi:uncharacterized protein (TIGR02246 family)